MMTNSPNPTFIKLPTVCSMTSLSKSAVYLKMSLDEFPKPVRVGKRAVSWLQHEVMDWLQCRIEQNRAEYN